MSETESGDVVRNDVVRRDRATERRWALDASDVISLLGGLVFVVMGLLALVDLGFKEFPSEVTSDVFGLAQTQIVGIVSIVLGLLMIAGSGAIGRSTTIFAGALTLVAGIVVVAAHDQLDATMATDKSYGWFALLIGAVVLIAAIAIPSVATRSDRVVDEAY
ncbi:MAG: hypothetical protein ABIY48_04525 [Acidimicrobiales bacterium]